ncbi:CDP-diacylglycerol--glycerol-3-phosphate 3-phosphatidyltransferase [Lentzea sp. NBRC 105346]|uniref:phosphatidylinositol phosphate synthase n=1 Tax=Lentzea sp. NBRC 105346 TaxID=3032205 RepID=UPI0024A0622C|nr:CDP-alcohol phosphatidyltransferase family protein [Lentzea sp. NBRC 105346]GLZ33487.1 CDP-diacylglycerol--glycerol-3-phosphate 3-phosphatidyltransferase [Lentzea sp. NBRC 105346]
MLNIFARESVSRVTDPIGRWLVARGLSPNVVTLGGSAAAIACAVWFLPRGQLFLGSALITACVLLDLIDGAMARAQGGGTKFGAVLDATCDRIVDGAVYCSLMWFSFAHGDKPTAFAGCIVIVGAEVISYVKARAEASGLNADGGIAERAERFIIALVGAGFQDLGVPHLLPIAMWILAALVVVTIVQRVLKVRRQV